MSERDDVQICVRIGMVIRMSLSMLSSTQIAFQTNAPGLMPKFLGEKDCNKRLISLNYVKIGTANIAINCETGFKKTQDEEWKEFEHNSGS